MFQSKNNYIKEKKGITLISLVVTIIVLIILAGVSINLILGDNGIITKAKEAKKSLDITDTIQNVRMAIIDKEMEKTIEGKDSSITNIELNTILNQYRNCRI